LSKFDRAAARLQLAEGLLNQIKQMSHTEQLQAMRDLASNKNTQISRSYGILSANTKLAFWYQLAQWMTQGFVVPMPVGYQLSSAGAQVIQPTFRRCGSEFFISCENWDPKNFSA
jgi:hypothetical protein